MKKSKLSLFNIIVLLSFICIGNKVYSQTEFEVTVDLVQSTFDNPQEGFVEALFTISFMPGEQNTFLSVGAQDNSTFLFDIIISNLMLPGSDIIGTERHEISQRFNINSLVQNNNPPSMLTCFIHILNGTGFYPFEASTFKDTKEVPVTEIIDNAVGVKVEEISVEIVPVSPPEHIVDDPLLIFRDRSKTSTNIDLVNESNGITSTYAGDLNACVPTATANSMHWLNKAYNDITLPESLTPRKTLEELSKFMKRPDGEGTTDEQMITGKLDFIEHYQLPIEVKYQSEFVDGNIASTAGNSIARNFNKAHKKPTWEFLSDMMMDGEDVEINYKWYNPEDNSWSAHSVNVTGFAEFKNGKKKIQIEHDMDQEKSGGTKREILEVTVNEDDPMIFSRDGQRPRYIRTIVAESPIIEEGRETAAWLNEIFAGSNSSNNGTLNKANVEGEVYLEVALRATVTDIENYQVQIYNGENGLSDSAVSLIEFTPGTPSNGLMLHTHKLNIPQNSNNHFGISITYSGSIIGKQFLSFGGEFVGIDGDATQMMTNDIGAITPGMGLALSGSGETYTAYSWKTTPEFTNGTINPSQYFTNSLPGAPVPSEPANGINEVPINLDFVWSSAQFATSYTLEIATDEAFTNVVYLEAEIIDTTQMVDNLASSQIYYWRIFAENGNGVSQYSAIWNFTTIVTGIDNISEVPNEFALNQNFPNPFNPTTTISYAIPTSVKYETLPNSRQGANVKLVVYDVLGRAVKTLVNKVQSAGNYEVNFDASDLTSGIYYYQLKSGDFLQTRKMSLLK